LPVRIIGGNKRHGFYWAGIHAGSAAVADKIDRIADVLAELNQLRVAGFLQKVQTFLDIDAAHVAMATQRIGNID
jgi:hypothetical protein